jgi:DNA-directed RNA polymerase subunit RPC12/RpoP
MCRYGFKTYKEHYLCFNCCKQFKQQSPLDKMSRDVQLRYHKLTIIAEGKFTPPKHSDKYEHGKIYVLTTEEQIELDTLNKKYFAEIKCPQCSLPMAGVGKDIQAPKRKEKGAWAALQKSYQLGYSFHSCGCGGPGFIPKDKGDYNVFLNMRLAEYELAVKRCDHELRTGVYNAQLYNHDRIFWVQKVEQIKTEINKLN